MELISKILFFFPIVLCYFHLQGVAALKCYTCNYNYGIDSEECLNDPASVVGRPVTNCNKKFCTIIRQEAKNPKGHIKSLSRQCADKPLFLNEAFDDGEFKTYYRSCTTDLCNNGNGISSVGLIRDPNQGHGENMVIKGINASTKLFTPFLIKGMFIAARLLVKVF
ncbi:uncharacterized protein LOC129611196 [Condylostylus longicornis]|uniref:uncharacterized protein LOC129611196 n=1 Tax=Condylostylus longicornis TaxID=2530218 RepID=UPI00244DCAB3|nr:uncharacterized protein LOC129611196 [Condylostylus longicornis]